ncbi:MAG: metalloregulator ArsR/SmtB family transcription factor [Acidobacteriia bacterium]|nr:metalloregulator ArsR/SmtB family transcription factor [Terriglobia bacterium]
MATDALDRTLDAISDPTRRRILRALKQAAASAPSPGDRQAPRAPRSPERNSQGLPGKNPCLCAGDIQERMHLSQPTISHHMAILTKAGLVEAVKRGQWRWYRRNEGALRRLVKTLRTKL